VDDAQFERFRQFVLGSIEQVGQGFTRPGEDWLPVMMLLTPGGGVLVRMDPRFLNTDAGKDRLVAKLSQLIRREHATAYALITSGWRSCAWSGSVRACALLSGQLRPADDPQRQEIVGAHLVDDVHAEYWNARVYREHEPPPHLGSWERFDDNDPFTKATGRFIIPLREALVESRASNN